MEQRKIPLRKCVITGERLPKKELFRVVRTPEGKVILDLSSKANGRGAYLKKDKDVIEKAQKTKTLDRILQAPVPQELFDELTKAIDE